MVTLTPGIRLNSEYLFAGKAGSHNIQLAYIRVDV